jgi:hypothetical protein
MMLVFTLMIAAAVVSNTVPALAGISCFCAYTFGSILYFLAVWIAVVFAFILALAAIEIFAFIVGSGMRLLLP